MAADGAGAVCIKCMECLCVVMPVYVDAWGSQILIGSFLKIQYSAGKYRRVKLKQSKVYCYGLPVCILGKTNPCVYMV